MILCFFYIEFSIFAVLLLIILAFAILSLKILCLQVLLLLSSKFVPINMLAISYRWFVRGGDLPRPSQAVASATSAPTAPSPLPKKHSCLSTASPTTGRTPYPVPTASTDRQTPARWRGICGYILVRSLIYAHTAHMRLQMAVIWSGTYAHIQERSLTPAHTVPIKRQWREIWTDTFEATWKRTVLEPCQQQTSLTSRPCSDSFYLLYLICL